jgi:NhaP-type Na+/H+ or K+/H+ antiporter
MADRHGREGRRLGPGGTRRTGRRRAPGAGTFDRRDGQLSAAILTTRFLLELCLLGALGTGGWALAGGGVLGGVAAVAAALAGALVWGAWIAPRARRRLRDPARFALETVLFVLVGAALWVVWAPLAGVLFAAASIVVAALTRVVGEPGYSEPVS